MFNSFESDVGFGCGDRVADLDPAKEALARAGTAPMRIASRV